MYDRGILKVQVVEARQDLARPLAHSFELQVPVLLAVVAQVARGEELCDKVDAFVLRVMPTPAAAPRALRATYMRRSHLFLDSKTPDASSGCLCSQSYSVSGDSPYADAAYACGVRCWGWPASQCLC